MTTETFALVLKTVLTASWQGSLVIVLILALRPFLGLHVPARWRCVLWAFVLGKLLVPAMILPSSPWSLENIPAIESPGEHAAIALDTAYTTYFSPAPGGNGPSATTPSAAPIPAPVAQPRMHGPAISWWRVGAVVWAAGVALMATWILGANLRLSRRIRRDARIVDRSLVSIWDACRERFSLSRTPLPLVVPWIDTPALVGVIRPVLLLPARAAASYSEGDWENVFMHELAHYRRRDPWAHALELATLCIHWFNPIVWWGFRFLATDRELATDELALRYFEEDRALGYGETLLKILADHSTRKFQPGMIGIVDDGVQLKQRFRRIVAFGSPTIAGSFVGFAAILAVASVVMGREPHGLDLSRYRGMNPADALVAAAAGNDLPALRKFLDDGLDIDGRALVPGEKTPLAAAAAGNQMETVRFLVMKGAAVNPAGSRSSPALLAAIRNGAVTSADYLLVKGAACDPTDLAAAKQEDASREKRDYQVSVPAPRGKIFDRNGQELATNRVRYNLAVNFETLHFSDEDALAYVRQQVALANRILPQRKIEFSTDRTLQHYKTWGMIPLDIALELTTEEQATVSKQGAAGLVIRPVTMRFYPQGTAAAHVVGLVGQADSLWENKPANQAEPNHRSDDQLAQEFEDAREGLEMMGNTRLTGKSGQRTYHFDAQGRKVSEEMTTPPQPGGNIITALDLNIQKRCEQALQTASHPGAMVIVDPKTGDILALASWPSHDPNAFVPSIPEKDWKAALNDPRGPLLARAYFSSYPPGSSFKPFVALAALESGAVTLDEKIPNPASVEIEGKTFRDWKDEDRGSLTVSEALEQNAGTWFYQAGIKTGAKPIIDWAGKVGFGKKTGALPRDNPGAVVHPVDVKKYLDQDGNAVSNGWLANLSIGQGKVLVTPLHMARAMAALGSGGAVYHSRLITEEQDDAGKATARLSPRLQETLAINP